MQSRRYRFQNQFHARPAAELLKIARAHGCRLWVKIDGAWQEAGMMNLLLRAAEAGAEIELGVEGGREAECLEELAKAGN